MLFRPDFENSPRKGGEHLLDLEKRGYGSPNRSRRPVIEVTRRISQIPPVLSGHKIQSTEERFVRDADDSADAADRGQLLERAFGPFHVFQDFTGGNKIDRVRRGQSVDVFLFKGEVRIVGAGTLEDVLREVATTDLLEASLKKQLGGNALAAADVECAAALRLQGAGCLRKALEEPGDEEILQRIPAAVLIPGAGRDPSVDQVFRPVSTHGSSAQLR